METGARRQETLSRRGNDALCSIATNERGNSRKCPSASVGSGWGLSSLDELSERWILLGVGAK